VGTYTLVQDDTDFSVWWCVDGRDFMVIDWNGVVIPDARDRRYVGGYTANDCVERRLTQAQVDAAHMVARSATSREVWYRYAKRVMREGGGMFSSTVRKVVS